MFPKASGFFRPTNDSATNRYLARLLFLALFLHSQLALGQPETRDGSVSEAPIPGITSLEFEPFQSYPVFNPKGLKILAGGLPAGHTTGIQAHQISIPKGSPTSENPAIPPGSVDVLTSSGGIACAQPPAIICVSPVKPASATSNSIDQYESLGAPMTIDPAPESSITPPPVFVDPEENLGQIAENDPRIKSIDPEVSAPPEFDILSLSRQRYTIYRREDDSISFLPGDGDQFGWLSFASSNYLNSKKKFGPTANFNMHLLSGPNSVALPPRLYDFELGFQSRRSLSELFSYDCSTMVGIYSDFEDSARDGVRFPSHAVGMFHPNPSTDWVFGVDYLGRDDIKVLPVFGFCWHDPARPLLRYEMIFPRPRVDLVLSKDTRLYSAGLLGGGTWDIEFPDDRNDVMTYRDYRFVIGVEQADAHGNLSAWELGWVYGRKLEFRSRTDERSFDDAFVIRFVSQH